MQTVFFFSILLILKKQNKKNNWDLAGWSFADRDVNRLQLDELKDSQAVCTVGLQAEVQRKLAWKEWKDS